MRRCPLVFAHTGADAVLDLNLEHAVSGRAGGRFVSPHVHLLVIDLL